MAESPNPDATPPVFTVAEKFVVAGNPDSVTIAEFCKLAKLEFLSTGLHA